MVVLQIDFQQALSSPSSKKLRSNWKLDPSRCLRVWWEPPPTSEIPQFQWWILCKKMWKWNYEIQKLEIPFMIHDSKTQNHHIFPNMFATFSKTRAVFSQSDLEKQCCSVMRVSEHFGAEFIACFKSCPHRVKWSAWCLNSFPHPNQARMLKRIIIRYGHTVWL